MPEPVFRYRSKSAARRLLEKQTALRKRHGPKEAVDRTIP